MFDEITIPAERKRANPFSAREAAKTSSGPANPTTHDARTAAEQERHG